MKYFRTIVHDQRIEARISDWGTEEVLVNGHVVSRRAVPWLMNSAHHFDVQDAEGQDHHIEIRRVDISKLGMGDYRMALFVDGAERARLEPIDARAPLEVCRNCGYALRGQPVTQGEVRCPECGRHTPHWDA